MSLNRYFTSAPDYVPTIGDGATILGYTDRSAATIVDVSANGRVVTVQRDRVKRVDDGGWLTESQTYEFERDDTAALRVYSKRKDGTYVLDGRRMSNGPRVILGVRSHYRDPSF